MAGASKRDQLIDTALTLFYRDGFTATGIDKILSEAGVAKMTLYNHFRSKEELICAVLHRRDENVRNWLMKFVEDNAETPRDRLLSLFDAHRDWFSGKDFRGCMFLNAAAEFSGIADPVLAIALEHKRLLHAYVRGLVAAANARNPDRLTDWLILLLDGAIGCAQVSLDADWADKAKNAARVLLDAELPEPAQGLPV